MLPERTPKPIQVFIITKQAEHASAPEYVEGQLLIQFYAMIKSV